MKEWNRGWTLNISSLPKYPSRPGGWPDARLNNTRPPLSPRTIRILLDLALLMAFAALLVLLRQTTLSFQRPTVSQAFPVSQPRPPLDFQVVQQRCDKVFLLDYSKVVELLGPPSAWSREPEFGDIEGVMAAHPDRYPQGPFSSEKWTDPKNKDRWVAVFFANGVAYHTLKKGF